MKNKLFLIALIAIVPVIAGLQIDLGKIGHDINKAVNNKSSLSNQDIIDGLKQALSIGSQNASQSASKADGFFKNPLIKIPFPPKAVKMEKTLRQMGMNKQVNDFILTMNRAAEEAAKQAAPIFVDAVKQMTINDGLGILKGKDTAATNYLRQKTSSALQVKFKPVIHTATQKVNVTKYWKPLITTYNKLPFVDHQNPDLDEYITQQALSGMFVLVSQEEIKIRKDPAARVTDLLKKVFGSK